MPSTSFSKNKRKVPTKNLGKVKRAIYYFVLVLHCWLPAAPPHPGGYDLRSIGRAIPGYEG